MNGGGAEMKKRCIGLGMVVWVIFFCFPCFAQEKFPNKPIFINVGQGAGGSTDIIARAFEPFLHKELKAPIVVQNLTGAGGDVVNNFIWKAKPDGYNLVMTALPSYIVREQIKKPGYKILEMSFIYGIAGGDFNAISVPYNSPIKNFSDLKKMASEKTLSAAGVTPGSNSWFAYILLRETTGIKFKYVPYDSGTEAATAAGGGHVDLAITSIISAVQPVQNKLIRLIATFSNKRDPSFPDVPTMVDLGYKDMHFVTRQGLAGPPKMPKEIVTIIANAAGKAVRDPKFMEIADRQGFTVDPMSASEFHQWAVGIYEQARKVLTTAGEIK
jgi:tripartite-type tricarboxylate transporter receptor subunit TctC